MKSLRESLFDIDNNIDKIDDTVTPKYWFDLLIDDKKYPKVLKDIIKHVKNDGGLKVSKNKIDINSDVCYVSTHSTKKIHIASLADGSTDYVCHTTNFVYSDFLLGKRKWFAAQIECKVFDDTELFPNQIIFRHLCLGKDITGKEYMNDNFDNMYTLPDKYLGIINKIIENDKH